MTEQEIQKVMKSLQLTREEAVQVLRDDEDINRGEAKDFDLTPEQQKNAKNLVKSSKKPANYGLEGKKPRKKAENPEKRAIIAEILKNCNNNYENVTEVNPEREISFQIGENCYSLTLTLHRKPKEK